MDINTEKSTHPVKFDRQVLNDAKFLRYGIEHLVEDCNIVVPRGGQFVINQDIIKGKLDLKGKTQFATKAEAIDFLLESVYPDWQMRDSSVAPTERRYGTA